KRKICRPCAIILRAFVSTILSNLLSLPREGSASPPERAATLPINTRRGKTPMTSRRLFMRNPPKVCVHVVHLHAPGPPRAGPNDCWSHDAPPAAPVANPPDAREPCSGSCYCCVTTGGEFLPGRRAARQRSD